MVRIRSIILCQLLKLLLPHLLKNLQELVIEILWPLEVLLRKLSKVLNGQLIKKVVFHRKNRFKLTKKEVGNLTTMAKISIKKEHLMKLEKMKTNKR